MSALSNALADGTLKASNLGFEAEWRPKEPLWRVYSEVFGPDGFNGTANGYARFSPLRRPDGTVVPTLYAGTTLDVALMETVLRDVPNPSIGFIQTLPAPSAEPRRVTELMLDRPLHMVDFSSIGLRRLGLARAEVIDCESANYGDTQALGAWVYAHTASAVHGIVWTSKQDDSAQAALLFGDRLPNRALVARNPGRSLQAGLVGSALTHLAMRLGVFLVFES